jgi:hypothetical protein
MSYTIIPLQPDANQTFDCVLDGGDAQINLETTDYGLFADVVYNGVAVSTGRLCLDRTDINPARYNGLPQALFFADLQGTSDPVATGFGTRYVLVYGNPPQTIDNSIIVSFGQTGRLDIDFILDHSILG